MVTPVGPRIPLREGEGFGRAKRNNLNLRGTSGLLNEGVF
jgi:hypothetical protein